MLDLSKKIVVLDRDGVINVELLDYVRKADDWEPIPGSLEAIGLFKRMGFRVYVATNQSGIGRGEFSYEDLELIHSKFEWLLIKQEDVRIDGIYFCPHAPVDKCHCRKPLPGLLHRLMTDINEDLTGVPFIGDSLRDLQAGWAAGCESILVRSGKGEYTIEEYPQHLDSLLIFDDLLSVAKDFEKRLDI